MPKWWSALQPGLAVSERRESKNIPGKWPFAKVTKWLYTLEIKGIEAVCVFISYRTNAKGKCIFQLSPFNSIRVQIYPTVIIYILCSSRCPDATYPVLSQSAQLFWKWRMFKVSIIYGHANHLGYVTCTKYINFLSLFVWRLYMKFDWNWLSSFREKVL